MKIATNTNMPYGYICPDYRGDDVSKCFEFMKMTRFRYADLAMDAANFEGSAFAGPNWRVWAEEISKNAKQAGIGLIQAHSSDSVFDKGEKREKTVSIIKRQIEVCGILGIPQIVVHGLMKHGNTWKQFRSVNKEFYESILETAEKNNVMILLENGCYQNSAGMYYHVTAELILDTIADLGFHPLMNACWDVGHAHMQGVDQYTEIIELGSRLKGLHIHDNFGGGDTHSMPFTGSCGYDSIIKGLVDSGYDGYFTMEGFSLMPASWYCVKRKGCEAAGEGGKKIIELPVEIYLQSENLMYEIAKYMLTQYDCFEE